MSFNKLIIPALTVLMSMMTSHLLAQTIQDEFVLPLKITPYLSGNYGELRSNHFHTGLDFKTQGVVGKDVICVDDGWISRISISPWGYGYALYVEHPNGKTSIYGHLLSFSKRIAEIARKYQYDTESYSINYQCKPGQIPVKRGEVIAKSGNSGSSGGPHLHFELRDTKTEETIDPTPYFKHQISDTTPPEIRLLRFYSLGGLVNGGVTPVSVTPAGKGINKAITGWGDIGIGIKAFDRMNGTSNIYGIRKMEMYVDGKLHFDYENDHFMIPEARYVNSLIDYDLWRNSKSQVMRLFTEPGNQLNCYKKVKDNGEIHINKERDYQIKIVLTDAFGNSKTINFPIKGVKGQLPPKKEKSKTMFRYDHVNMVDIEPIRFILPKGAIYSDFDFHFSVEKTAKGYSDIFHLHNKSVPLHQYCELQLKVTRDSLEDKSKYYLAERIGSHSNFVSSNYNNGYLKGSVRSFGDYWITADTIPPVVTPIQQTTWTKKGVIKYKMADAQSGIKSWEGYIDGKFALFEYNGKNGIIEYHMDTSRIGKGKRHLLKVIITDNCNNQKQTETSFYW